MTDFDLFKKHVRADDSSADDELLSSYWEAAKSWALASTRRTEAELTEIGGGALPPQFRHAVLMLASHFYNQSEGTAATAVHSVPYGISAMLKPLTRLSNDSGQTSREG